MGMINGVHHLAVQTGNIKNQIAFFTDVLGMELKGLFWMHGVAGAWHAFLRLDDDAYMSFVEIPENRGIEPAFGLSHAKNPRSASAPGTMQHVAFNVKDDDELLALRDRIRDRGVNVMGPLEHGICKSIYFAGPESLTLEISSNGPPMDAEQWIDPEVVELAGISEAELATYKTPAVFSSTGGQIPQPPVDPSKPQLGYPADVLDKLMNSPDTQLNKVYSYSDPPVNKKANA
jgi:catechol 2,3-dioxygenase-like lactoylglutathione lyase family enzyme